MFSHHQPLRRWATRVLLLWLLSLGASVANGCLAPVQLAPAAAVSSPVQGAPALDPPASHHCEPDPQSPGAQTNCKDFCAKASVSVPTPKSALDDLQAQAPPGLPGVTVQPARLDIAPAQGWVPRRDGAIAPPIPIAFLRLAL